MTCAKCGASFSEAGKFCAKCGTARPARDAVPALQKFCNGCGSAFRAADKYCPKCGAVRGQNPSPMSAPPATPSVSSPLPISSAQSSPVDALPPPDNILASSRSPQSMESRPAPQMAQAEKSSSKFILAILLVVALFAFSAVAGIVYIGFRIKKKAEEIRQADKQNDGAALLRAITGKSDTNPDRTLNSQPDEASKSDGLNTLVKALAGGSDDGKQGSSSSGQNDETGAAMKKLAGDGAEALMRKMMGGSAEIPKLPEWKAAPPDLISSPTAKIPFRASLQLVVAGTEPARGDFESIFLVDSVTDKQIHISGHQQFPKHNDLTNIQAQSDRKGFTGTDPGSPDAVLKINCSQIEFKADLENSAESSPYFCMQGREDKFPGTTSLSFSRKTFMDLKTAGDTPFIAHENPMNQLFKSFRDLVSGSGDPSEFLNRVLNAAPGSTPPPSPPLHYTLHRAGPDVAFPVLINEQPTQLPALHATVLRSDGTSDGDVYILDEPDNPLILAGQTKPFGTAQTVKISWKSDTNLNPIEQQLQKEGRAKIYGIYFDFGSNQLRAESDAVLNEIAEALRDHPEWKLNIEGHTDNIGGDAYNQNLSTSRALAVKKALTAGYTIGESRLTTQGFGDTRPAASNDTLEGRALNRRVELVRN